MSQNTQQYSHMGTDLQALPLTSENDPLAQGDTLKIIACPVCRAVYVPSKEHQDHVSALLLETAFLEICHFCFRCQRPACPQCWNPVHHSCASCCEEARLPFRGPVPALEGLVFLPPSAHSAQDKTVSFICQRNGRFYAPESPAPESAPQKVAAVPEPVAVSAVATTTSGPVTSVAPSAQTALTQASASAYPGWLQEVLGQKPGGSSQASEPVSFGTDRPANPVLPGTSPDPAPVSWSQPDWPHLGLVGPQPGPELAPGQPAEPVEQPLPSPVPSPAPDSQSEAAEVNEQESGEEISLFERVENVLIILTSILLLAVVLMIVLSICFAQVNTFFLALVHIDIRTEIAYLLQLK